MRLSVFFLVIFLSFSLGACARTRGPEHYYFGSYSEAEQLYNEGEYGEAIEKYREYIDENPEGNLAVISRYYIAKSYGALGKSDQAEEIYKEIVKNHPDLVWANFAETQLKGSKNQKK